MTAEKAVLIPGSIQEPFLSFRPRWLVQFYRLKLQPSREFRERNRHIWRTPRPTGCAGRSPLRASLSTVFRDNARKSAARSGATNGSCVVGVFRSSISHLFWTFATRTSLLRLSIVRSLLTSALERRRLENLRSIELRILGPGAFGSSESGGGTLRPGCLSCKVR